MHRVAFELIFFPQSTHWFTLLTRLFRFLPLVVSNCELQLGQTQRKFSRLLSLPGNVSMSFEDRPNECGCTNAAAIRYWDAKGREHVLSEYDVYRIEERDNTHTNFLYRGFIIELDPEDQWYWIFYLSNKRNHRWSGRSIAACCDIIDEVCNEMMKEDM